MSFACVLHFAMSSSAFHLHVFQNLHPFGFRRFSPLSVLSQTLSHAPAAPPKYYFISGIKCSRIGMSLGLWSYYSVDRAPVKFRRIRSSFDSPTVKYIAAPSPVYSSDVSVSEIAAGLSSSSLFSAQPTLYHPLGPTYSSSRPEPFDGDHTVQKPLLTT